jgi:hypothetical protein
MIQIPGGLDSTIICTVYPEREERNKAKDVKKGAKPLKGSSAQSSSSLEPTLHAISIAEPIVVAHFT